ncbi:hypothetical protein [Nonomuraea sp. NPDC050202]|uniref:hypothetical protein n=1 Tax=Nonomuraea sp. NPDC050202 TaxID=3155035 RepID=UPI00340EDBAC
MLFLANPPLDRPVPPFVHREGQSIDIAHLARTSGVMFGLLEVPTRPATHTSG